ncbi:MAG: winged helix-turn-helix transcriptional regulator, partial [Lachnospiraceae bacterium]|nr:winged helix-turn-helix transcriptional regulator [Lachnospiraceae bacterium]
TQKGIAKTAEIADAVGLSQPRVRVLLAELVAEGIVEPQGEGRARAYKKVIERDSIVLE